MIREIIWTIDPTSTGDADPDRYAAYLENILHEEYPSAVINVTVGTGPQYIDTDDLLDEEEATSYIKECWDSYDETENPIKEGSK